MPEIDYTKWEYPEQDLEVLTELYGYIGWIDDVRKTFWFVADDGDQFEIPFHILPFSERPHLIEGAFARRRHYRDPDYRDEVVEEFIFNKRTWSEGEIEKAQREGKELSEKLNWG